PSLARTPAELVRGLHSADEWWRARAQRLLVEQREFSAVPALEQSAAAAPLAATRVRTLWTLRAFGALSSKVVQAALRDPDAGVREQAVTLAAELLPQRAGLAEPLLAMAGDGDARVRFVTALALGSWADGRAVAPLAEIAARDGQDRWVRAAVLSGVGQRLEPFLREFARRQGEPTPTIDAVMEDLGRLIGAGDTAKAGQQFLREILAVGTAAPWRVPAALGLAEGVRGRADFKLRTPGAPLAALLAEPDEVNATALRELFLQATTTALDERATLLQRNAAVALLGHTDYAQGAAGLGGLLAARQPPELQLQAVRAFERAGDPRGGELLVQGENWSGYTPQIRGAVIASLLAKPALVRVLFTAIRRGEIKPPEVPSLRRAELLKHANPELRAEAAELFQSLEGGDRMAVYRAHREILATAADPAPGAAVFARVCSACHTFQSVGGKVGPDLTGFRHQPADALLLHILVPNYEVAPGYQAMAVTTRDGRSLSGWLAAETAGSITLRTAFGTEETVLRESISSLSGSGVSLMPDGLEQAMTKAELATLIAYLKSAPNAAP
ncbi:MAG: HEAT repeat domain-containing protein, partial [Devosia sp.]